MSINAHRSIFSDGQLQKQIRCTTRRGSMFAYIWALEPDTRKLIHKGKKP